MELDGEIVIFFLKVVRLWNLMYFVFLYMDVVKKVIKKGDVGEEEVEQEELFKVYIGKVLIMFRL